MPPSVYIFTLTSFVIFLLAIFSEVVLSLPNANGVTYVWKTKPWRRCEVECGAGRRFRAVSCRDSSGNSVPDYNCDPADRPDAQDDCFIVCDRHRHLLRWETEPWSRCTPAAASCVATSTAGVARRRVRCVLAPRGDDVDAAACANFWGRPEEEMACSLDAGDMLECPQDCVTTKRNVSCPPHTCPSKNKWSRKFRELMDVIVAPSEGGAPCPSPHPTPVCPNTDEECHDTDNTKKRYLLKIGEWGPCLSPGRPSNQNVVQTSLRPIIGLSRRNVTCITDKGESESLSLCNVVHMPATQRKCLVPSRCLTSPWTEWRVRTEGCITSGGHVYPEVRTRVRRVVQMPVGPGAEPCPPLFEERSVGQDLPACYKYQWLPLEWSECQLRVNGPHGNKQVLTPTCGSGLQYREMVCVRASDASPVHDASQCREPRPPALRRCQVPCRRECHVAQWSRWGPCTFLKGHNQFETMENGYRRRERSVTVSPSHGGSPCPHLQEAAWCQQVEEFKWRYGKWSECALEDAASCGVGTRTRDKTCVKVNGDPLSDFYCNRHHFFSEDKEECHVPCPDDCVISEWSGWSTCDLPCRTGDNQGEKTRNRTLIAIKGKNGTCPAFDLTDDTHCNENSCEPFRWTAGAWGSCDPVDGGSACGAGVQRRQVECTHGTEDAVEFALCNYLKVPSTERHCQIPCPVDCVLTNFSDWTPCEGSCDSEESVQSRHRLVLASPQHGGTPCPESLVEQRTCSRATEPECVESRRNMEYAWSTGEWSRCVVQQKCGMGFQVRNMSCLDQRDQRAVEPFHCYPPVDAGPPPPAVRSCEVACSSGCVLSAWSAWTHCGRAHDARRTRTREVVGPPSEKEKCRSAFKLQEEEKCPTDEINDSDLHWMSCIVDGTNTSYVGYSCGDGYRYKLANTGSGPGLERDFCWQDCPVDCRMSEWGEWSDCDAPCGAGFRQRQREVIVKANDLGRPCPEGVDKIEVQRDVCRVVCADFHWWAGGWSKCHVEDKKCGNGVQHRTVRCLNKRTEQEVNESKCDPLEKPESTSNCTLHCPGECVMSPWTLTTKCQEPCSPTNHQVKTRTILRQPHPTAAPCPQDTVSRAPCVVNSTCHEHSLEVGPWGSCVMQEGALCGEGTQKAPLRCVRSDGRQVDPVVCEKTHQSLSLKEPTSKPCYVDCPVDCVMTEWTAWNDTQCGACSHGTAMTRTRNVLQPPSDAGRPCPEEVEQRMPCSFKPCYHWKHTEWSSCDLESGDCGHGVRRRVVTCVRSDGLHVDRSLCLSLNATFHKGGWIDPAWLAVAQEHSQEEQACHVPCPGECLLSEWSVWSHCHKNCRIGQQVGYQTSSRVVLSSPQNATEYCPGQLLRTRPCWSNDCNFFRWKLKNGTLICERNDGIIVQGGCNSLPPPCDRWCEKLGGLCNGTSGQCRCEGGPLLAGPEAGHCPEGGNGPRPPANHSATDVQLKYYPDDSQVSFWMYAMISIGTAFVIFVAVTVYLMCRSSLRQRPLSVERQPSMRRRDHTSKHSNNCTHAEHPLPN